MTKTDVAEDGQFNVRLLKTFYQVLSYENMLENQQGQYGLDSFIVMSQLNERDQIN